MLKGKNILITGGAGFIGSWLTEYLYQKNNITVFDTFRRNSLRFAAKEIQNSIRIIKGDIQNFKQVQKATINQDIIFHLAAIAGASIYEKEPLLTMNVNLLGGINLLKNLEKSNVDHLILFSTSEVYGLNAQNVSEEDQTYIGPTDQGRWSYAISKLALDHLTMAYLKTHKLPITIVRPFNIYGPRQVGEGAIAKMIVDSLLIRRINVTGDGSQKRSWCYITDLIEALMQILTQKPTGVFNIGNPQAYYSIKILAQKIQKISQKSRLVFKPKPATEIEDRLPDIAKAQKTLSFSPKINLDIGLQMTYEWYKENIQAFKKT